MVHLLIYSRDNKNLVLRYYDKIEDAPIYDLLRQDIINTDKKWMVLSESRWQDYQDTSRSTGSYTVFYQGGKNDHFTHVPGPVAKSSSESDYSTAFTAGINLAHPRMKSN